MAQATLSKARRGYVPVDRQALGEELAALGCVRKVGPSSYLVISPASGNAYLVDHRRDPWGSYDRWECQCPDRRYRQTVCKHIRAVKVALGIRDEEAYFEPEEGGDEEADPYVCRQCGAYLSHPKGLCSLCAAPKGERRGWEAVRC